MQSVLFQGGHISFIKSQNYIFFAPGLWLIYWGVLPSKNICRHLKKDILYMSLWLIKILKMLENITENKATSWLCGLFCLTCISEYVTCSFFHLKCCSRHSGYPIVWILDRECIWSYKIRCLVISAWSSNIKVGFQKSAKFSMFFVFSHFKTTWLTWKLRNWPLPVILVPFSAQ